MGLVCIGGDSSGEWKSSDERQMENGEWNLQGTGMPVPETEKTISDELLVMSDVWGIYEILGEE